MNLKQVRGSVRARPSLRSPFASEYQEYSTRFMYFPTETSERASARSPLSLKTRIKSRFSSLARRDKPKFRISEKLIILLHDVLVHSCDRYVQLDSSTVVPCPCYGPNGIRRSCRRNRIGDEIFETIKY